jgi:putative transposase
VVGAHRSNVRYRSRRPPQTALRTRLKELATTHVSYGYLRLHVLLRREGWRVNRRRVYRLYREEGLMLKPRRPKRHRTAAARVLRPATERPNERWAMDFVHDTLAGARTIRILTVLDVHTRGVSRWCRSRPSAVRTWRASSARPARRVDYRA